MARCPFAIWRPMPYATSLMPNPVRANAHTAVTNAASLFPYFAYQSGKVHSHFYVAKGGTIEQYRDTAYRAAADLQGNPDTISIETWDGYPLTFTSAATVIEWTPEQVEALTRLLAWILDEHPTIPRRLATTSKADATSHGIGWHRLGVPATYAQLALGRSQTGGKLWSRKVGKTCPGDKRIAQMPGILADLQGAPSGGIGGGMSPVVVPRPEPKKNARAARAYKPGEVARIQTILAALDYYHGAIDDDYGDWTYRGALAYQRAQEFGGLRKDGDWGPATEAHYQWVLTLQRALNDWKGADIRVDGDYGSATDARVWEVMRRNHGGAYPSWAKLDGVPGPVFCRMLAIPTHPNL